MKDEFRIPGQVSIEEWDWRKHFKLIVKHLHKYPEVYTTFDTGKIMGIVLALDTTLSENTRLMARINDIEQWTPVSAKACPLCMYQEGKFISACSYHTEIQ